jgi:hypothetical protein
MEPQEEGLYKRARLWLRGTSFNDANTLSSRSLLIALGIIVLAGAIRFFYIIQMDIPAFDPWRHLQLIANIRGGKGFSLFNGQPYIWYSPPWYYLCAALPAAVRPEWIAGLFSSLCAGLLYLWVRLRGGAGSGLQSVFAGLMCAAFGPMAAFTCHYGSEAFALCLMLAGLVFSERRSPASAGAAGLLMAFAAAARPNIAWYAPVALLALRNKRQIFMFLLVFVLAAGAFWWRNHAVIMSYPYLFTVDGIAAGAGGFSFLSTLVVQMHPTVSGALRHMYGIIMPAPEWLSAGGIFRGELIFMALGLASLLLARKRDIAFAALATFVSLLLFDPTLTGNFFRINLGLFPLFFVTIIDAADRIGGGMSRRSSWAQAAAAALVIVMGANYFVPEKMVPLDMATPPPELLKEDRYMVNYGFYHPESLAFRFPSKKFIGMPAQPGEIEAFFKAFPEYRFVLWHELGLQPDMAKRLFCSPSVRLLRTGENKYGLKYCVLKIE